MAFARSVRLTERVIHMQNQKSPITPRLSLKTLSGKDMDGKLSSTLGMLRGGQGHHRGDRAHGATPEQVEETL